MSIVLRVSSLRLILILILANFAGCQSATEPAEDLVPVSGTVKFDGLPAEGVVVKFFPRGNNKAHPGFAKTDSEGQFEMLNYQGKKGLPVGTYAVVFSLWLMPDGSAPPSDQRPALSGAGEVMPMNWSELPKAGKHNTVNVPDGGKDDFEFKIPKTEIPTTSLERFR